ncbi:DnaD domain-containing protein [Macrococcoides caseolyticum]|uniref:DnaD domain-containing protein n=1 Tax=Macrococcoides caseolyticum TaxID=69966 RepID=UPI0018E0FF29|nr:DnaD domain protein [Macrococcus caseolyticus]QQB05836.1 DnaD domain protein [Macrococcus caseolyticus]
MSKLLMDEHPIQVMPTLASHIGLNEAIILQQMHYWLSKSNHKHDGRMWIYNTVKGWAEQFPFWSESTIKRAINNLIKKELVLIGNYNKAKFDKTLWYSIDYEKLDELERVNNRLGQNDLTSSSKRPNGEVQNDQRKESDWSNGEGQDDQTNTIDYTETTTETIPETTTKEDQVAVEDKEFASVYKFYTENINPIVNNTTVTFMSDDLKEFGIDLVIYAMEQAALNNITRYAYIQSILKRCKAENIKTREQAEFKALEKARQRGNYKNNNQSKEMTPEWINKPSDEVPAHNSSNELSDDELEKEREKLRKELEESAREFEDKEGVRHHA